MDKNSNHKTSQCLDSSVLQSSQLTTRDSASQSHTALESSTQKSSTQDIATSHTTSLESTTPQATPQSAQSIIFGPVFSRRFGLSLGVDLSPTHKQCNFDCVYCELHKAKPIDSMESIVSSTAVISAITQALEKNPHIDVLTFTATGEPTLYPHLYEVLSHIAPLLKSHYPNIKSLILSNGSQMLEQKDALMLCDIVKFSLDAMDSKAFARTDRPSKSLILQRILEGIRAFAQVYQGSLVAEVLLVKGHNDTPENLCKIAEFLRSVRIDRVDLGSIDRPSAYAVKALSAQELRACAKFFDGLPISLPERKNNQNTTTHGTIPESNTTTHAEIMKLLATRPIALSEAHALLGGGMQQLLELVDSKQVVIKQQGTHSFYTQSSANQ